MKRITSQSMKILQLTSAFSSSFVMMVIPEDPGKNDIKNAAADCRNPKPKHQSQTHTEHTTRAGLQQQQQQQARRNRGVQHGSEVYAV